MGPITFTDSASSVFVQIADLVAYNTLLQFRMHGGEWEEPTGNSLPLYEHFRNVAALFDRGPQQQISGYGVAKWPVEKKIGWVFPEKA